MHTPAGIKQLTDKMTTGSQASERPCSEADLSEQDRECKYTVGNDASTNDQGTVFDWPVLQQVGVVLGVLLDQLGVIIRKGNKSSQGNGSQSVLYIFALQNGLRLLAQDRGRQ